MSVQTRKAYKAFYLIITCFVAALKTCLQEVSLYDCLSIGASLIQID